jgi:hypothetical protein
VLEPDVSWMLWDYYFFNGRAIFQQERVANGLTRIGNEDRGLYRRDFCNE